MLLLVDHHLTLSHQQFFDGGPFYGAASLMSDPLIGQIVGGCEIVRLLGKGGMSSIYLAHQKSVNREVAIKILSGGLLGDPTFMERFTREVETTARLQNPHIIPIYDYGQTDGQPYIVMAYISGGSLADLIGFGALELDTSARLVRQVAQALDFAHGHGVIHRDIKPANILLDSQQNAILTDFGVAHVIAATEQLTRDDILGTPSYLAPEMLSDRNKVTPAVDIYALGVTLYHMLAGSLPFTGDTPVQLMWSHVNDPVPLMTATRADLPIGVDAILQRALAKAPAARYHSAGDLAADLDAVLAGSRPAIAEREQLEPTVKTRRKKAASHKARDLQQAVSQALDQVVKIVRPDGITGSGLYMPGDQVITCNHVVEGAQGVYVRLHSGEQIEADVLAAELGSDLALVALRATPASLSAERLSGVSLKPGQPEPGEELVAIGHPLGLDWSVTGGHYNAHRQPGEEPLPHFGINLTCPLVQVDVVINAGSSGGPILDGQGRLVGIADSIINPAVANNIGFAIDGETALEFWRQHREDKDFLGPFSCGHHHAQGVTYCPLTGKPIKPLEAIPMPSEQNVRYSCGHSHPSGLTYCPLMGKPAYEIEEIPAGAAGDAPPVAPVSLVKCTNCGFEYPASLASCPHCGKPRR
jgi:S1-C subfamily serine protease/predicted Ser/Thr protein kinase